MKDVKKQLQLLGLNEKQADLYLALLKLGSSLIGMLEKKLKLHKQIIYNELEKLIEKGLVFVTVKNNRRNFQAADPEVLVEKLESQKKVAEGLVPDLHSLIGWDKGISEVRIYEGLKGFQAFHRTSIKLVQENSEILVIGAGGDKFLQLAEVDNLFDWYEIVRQRKNIKQRFLMHENQRNDNPKYIINRFKHEVRFLDDEIMVTMAVQIWPDHIAMLFFLDQPKIIEIKSIHARENFKRYFEILWCQAKN